MSGEHSFDDMIELLKSTSSRIRRFEESLQKLEGNLYHLEYEIKTLFAEIKTEVKHSTQAQRNITNDLKRWQDGFRNGRN